MEAKNLKKMDVGGLSGEERQKRHEICEKAQQHVGHINLVILLSSFIHPFILICRQQISSFKANLILEEVDWSY